MSASPAAGGDERRAGHALVWRGLQLGLTRGLYLVGTLILGRLLTPSDFGLVAIATVAITTVMTATDTGMSAALVQSAHNEQIHYDVAWTVGLLRGSLVCLALLLAAPLIARLFGNDRAVALVRLMALMPLLNSIASPRLADLIRDLRFSWLALIGIGAVLVELALSIGLAHRYGGGAIITGKVAGAATTCLLSYVVAPHRPRIRLSMASTRTLIHFGRWMFAIGLIAVASDLFLKVLVSRQLGVAGLGLFSLADRLAEAPNQLAMEAVAAVAFPLYVRLRQDPQRMQAVLRAHLTGLMFMLLPATALLVALAQPLETRVLGAAWVGSSRLIVLLSLAFSAEVAFSAISPLLQALGRGSRLFTVELMQYVTLIACVATLTGPYGLLGIGVARIAAAVVVQTASTRAAAAYLKPIYGPVLRTGLCLVALALCAGAVAWFAAQHVSGAIGVACAALAGLGAFLALAWLADAPLGMGVRDSLAMFFPFLAADRPRLAGA